MGVKVLVLVLGPGGGGLPIGTGKRHARIVVPALKEIRVGVDIGASVHLLTAFEANGRTVVARSAALQKYAARAGPLARARRGQRPTAGQGTEREHRPAARHQGPAGTRCRPGPRRPGWLSLIHI